MLVIVVGLVVLASVCVGVWCATVLDETGGNSNSESWRLVSKKSERALVCLLTFSFLRWFWFSPFLNAILQGGQRSEREVLSNFRLQSSFLHVFCMVSAGGDEKLESPSEGNINVC